MLVVVRVKVEKDEEKIIRIRLDLEGNEAKRFRYIKECRGLKNNTELVRILLKEEYVRLGGKPLL